MHDTPKVISDKRLLRGSATAPDAATELQQRIFDPLAGRSTTVKITVRTDKGEHKPDIDYFSITRDVSS
jgi:hypothetical protein